MRLILPLLVLLSACTKVKPSAPSADQTAPVIYACAGRVAVTVAHVGDSVVLGLPDGRALTLRHVVSGSGARYSDDTVTWWSKGDSGFVMTGDSVTIKDCGIIPNKVRGD